MTNNPNNKDQVPILEKSKGKTAKIIGATLLATSVTLAAGMGLNKRNEAPDTTSSTSTTIEKEGKIHTSDLPLPPVNMTAEATPTTTEGLGPSTYQIKGDVQRHMPDEGLESRSVGEPVYNPEQ